MPEAYIAYNSDWARVPRTLFEHAHIDDNALFPPYTGFGQVVEVFMLMPDNFHGLDSLTLWCLGGSTAAVTLDVTIDIGTCAEAYNIHTQTVNNIAYNQVINQYYCLDLTTPLATVLANLAARDMLWLKASESSDETQYIVGLELQET